MKLLLTIIIFLSLLATSQTKGTKDISFLTPQQQDIFGTVVEYIGNTVLNAQERSKDGHSLFGFERKLGYLWQNPLSCGACKATLFSADFIIDNAVVRPTLEKIVAYFCSKSLEYEVWLGAVQEMGDILVPQVMEFLLGPSYGCGRLTGFCKNPAYKTLDPQDYIDKILADKPEFIKDNDYVNKQYRKIAEDKKERKNVKVLHISDLHLDFQYEEGMNMNWDEPVCCRAHNGPAPTPADAAGKYGALADCDLPPITAEMVFEKIKSLDEKPDVIFWTGDNTPHDIWNQSNHYNAEYTIKISDWMQEHLPNVPVFPTPGNHEFFPVNVMDFNSQDPVLAKLAEVWSVWLDEESFKLFKKNGYYSMPLKGKKETWDGYRVLSINTAACNNMNWNLISQTHDPTYMLEWLEQELSKMEQNGEKAFIIGHVQPGGGSCINAWSERYRALMERYQHLILSHFFGHTHDEQIQIITDTKNEASIHVLHAPGSVTTYSNHNPQFRILDVDYETGYPVKAHKYYFNITQANLGDPKWEYQYELTEEYGMKDFSPESFKNLTLRFKEDKTSAGQYKWNVEGRTRPRSNYNCESESCMKGTYWNTAIFLPFERSDCKGKPRHDFRNDYEDAFFELLLNPYVKKVE